MHGNECIYITVIASMYKKVIEQTLTSLHSEEKYRKKYVLVFKAAYTFRAIMKLTM